MTRKDTRPLASLMCKIIINGYFVNCLLIPNICNGRGLQAYSWVPSRLELR